MAWYVFALRWRIADHNINVDANSYAMNKQTTWPQNRVYNHFDAIIFLSN
jgi:hypothetical protein